MSHAEPPDHTESLPHFEGTLVPARGVAKLPHLEAFLPECRRIVRRPTPSGRIDSVAGWGFKPSARYARSLATSRGWPYLALEDGFLRSVGLGEAGAPPMSLLVDDLGVYYDARAPSRLERLLQQTVWETPELNRRAREFIDRIVETGLSKTNSAPPMSGEPLGRSSGRRILVVDQTLGDASIPGALADSHAFLRMIEAARRDEGDAQIVVRRHPAVSAGLKRGCLAPAALRDLVVVDQNCRVSDILSRIDAVYTVSSLTGLEALLRGLPVRCFGLPFYAGWGLTRDEMACPRRTRRHTIESFAAAAYLLYPRYVDPVVGEPTTPERALERLLSFRDRSDANAGYTACLGFAPWKHGAARTLLYSPRGGAEFFRRTGSALENAAARGGRLVFWAGRETPEINKRLSHAKAPVWLMEDGFIRSAGLGSDFHRAASVVLDDEGVYYDATRPSRLERLLEKADFDEAVLRRAALVRQSLIRAGLSKYNLWQARADTIWPSDQEKILVVGQVEDDKSILKGCEGVRTNLELLRAIRARRPNAFLVFKPHPDVESGNRAGAVDAAATLKFADAVAPGLDIHACLSRSDGVATMTSLAGFEALLRGKPVWTFGRPFYAGWGLTRDDLPCPRRRRRLTLDQLVAGALIAYPIYVHPVSGLPCEPEDLICYLERRREAGPRSLSRRLRYWRAIWESIRFRATARY